MSIAALNAAIGTDRMIFLVAQRDIACDTPRADDLYTVGTICRLSQILRAPGGGNVKCIVDGLYRAKPPPLTAATPAPWANVRVLADQPVDAHAAVLFHDVRREKARGVPRVLILQPRVAGRHDRPLHAAAIGKEHHSNSEEMLISS